MSQKNQKILLAIPFYNCEKQIIRIILKLSRNKSLQGTSKFDIVLIDNKSEDNSKKLIIKLIKQLKIKNISYFLNNNNYGLGGSHKIAFNYCLEKSYYGVVVLHGDDQANFDDFLSIYQNINNFEKYDVWFGSRFMKDSILKGYSKIRIIGNLFWNLYMSCALFKKVLDLGSGLNFYKSSVLCNRFFYKMPDSLSFQPYFHMNIIARSKSYIFFPISWKEEDQISNAKLFKQTIDIIKIGLMLLLLKIKKPNKNYRMENHFLRSKYSYKKLL